MLIKLIEIYDELSHVEKAENFKKKHMLREIVINTDFIVMLRTDSSIEKYITDNPTAYEGLEKGQKFTRMTINKGSISNDLIILGSIDNILKMLDINNKKVIKG